MATEDPDRQELLDELRALRRELAEVRHAGGTPADAAVDVRYRAVVDNLIDGIVTIDERGVIESFNPAAARIFGYQPSEVVGRGVQVLMPTPYRDEHEGYIERYLRTGDAHVIGQGREVTGQRKDGSQFPMDLSVGEFVEGGRRKFTGVIRDITKRKQLEEQLLQAQKMESVGQLAGGVAHDFNNQLGIILFDVDILLAAVDGDGVRSDLQKIRKTVLRAADLTRQLLVFSRRQRMQPQVLNLNRHVAELRKMMVRLLGEDIDVRLDVADDPCTIEADPGNLDQVLINLCVNARDAMPDGGTLHIRTLNVLIDEDYCRRHSRGVPGRYSCLTVTDEGHGMEEGVRSRIFEPFFTTKESGKGTGLGLSMVYGIIEAHGGWITVDSEPHSGARFEVFLPAHDRPPDDIVSSTHDTDAEHGQGERILLIEDEPDLRDRMEHILEGRGYRVTACSDLAAARRGYREGLYELILSDVVLPDGRGPDFCFELLSGDPGLRVIVLSGYSDGRVDWNRVRASGFTVLRKPVGVAELLEKVRSHLDSG